jgi:hypothetical protein
VSNFQHFGISLIIPSSTLSDPLVKALLQESDLFARSFSGSGFGLISPLDFIFLLRLPMEICAHLVLIISLTGGATHYGVLLLSIFSAILPLLVTWFGCPHAHSETLYSPRETRAADRQEKMRNLAYNEAHRPEIELFGLGDWILKTWASARRVVLDSEQSQHLRDSSLISKLNFSDFLFALQNVGQSKSLCASNIDPNCLDSTCSIAANLLCITWISDAVSQLYPIGDSRFEKLAGYFAHGFSRHFLDVGFLRRQEFEAQTTTRRGCILPDLSQWCDHQSTVGDPFP